MSRLFLFVMLFALLYTIEARHKSHHKQHHHECKRKGNTDKIFRRFYEDVIEVDRKEENFCEDLTNVMLKEYYGQDFYKLIVPLKNATEAELTIKTHHRALLVKVEDVFTIMRVLPQIVDPNKSSYVIEEGNVKISFSYNIEMGKEVEVNCDNEIENKSRHVIKAEIKNQGGIQPAGTGGNDINHNVKLS